MRTLLLLFVVLGSSLAVLLFAIVFTGLHRGIEHGKLEVVEFDSKAMGHRRRMVIYTPPNYSRDEPYPVLYLFHGGGDDENSWLEDCGAGTLLDRLYSEKKIVPMIAVMPNAQGRGMAFEHDLLEEVVPFIESHYATRSDERAIAGVSLGGGQALDIGLKHADRFAWVGGFSPALAGISESDLLSHLAAWKGHLKLLWLSCGDRERCKGTSESLHQALEDKKVSHVWKVSDGEHGWTLWKNELPQFIGLLFRHEPSDTALSGQKR